MSYTLLSETKPKARKQHRCIWCGEKILIGETYRREKSVYDGSFQDHKWHLECDNVSADYFSNGEEEFDPYDNERPIKRMNDNITTINAVRDTTPAPVGWASGGGIRKKYIAWKAPSEHNGVEITRAVGRLCSGDTLCTLSVVPPTLDLVLRTSSGKPHWVCTRF